MFILGKYKNSSNQLMESGSGGMSITGVYFLRINRLLTEGKENLFIHSRPVPVLSNTVPLAI